jgi:SnoaL-like protein
MREESDFMSRYEEIQQLAYRFCHHHDARNAAGVANCFARDTTHIGAVGRDAIESFFASVYSTSTVRRRHVLTNMILTAQTDTTASAVAYELLYLIKDNRPELQITGLYCIDVILEDGEWKINKLEPRLDVPYDPGDTPQVVYELTPDGYYAGVPGELDPSK